MKSNHSAQIICKKIILTVKVANIICLFVYFYLGFIWFIDFYLVKIP